jgi:hypothetical protein
MKSYVFINIIKYIYKGNRMAPTDAELIKRIICEGFLIIALGAVICEKHRMELFLKWWIHIQQQSVLKKKYLELKNLEVEVFRVEV